MDHDLRGRGRSWRGSTPLSSSGDSEGWYAASVPAIAGCHTQANSLDGLMVRVREAIEANQEVA
jgi:predicted RNase H-like HicB family nuclease